MKLITDTTKLTSAIKRIKSAGQRLDTAVHTAACSTLAHVRDHGNTTLVVQLLDAMPKSGRRKALIDWFVAFAPMAIEDSKKNGVKVTLAKGRTPDQFLVDEGIAMPFWDFTPDKSTMPITLDVLVKRFINGLKKVEGVDESTKESIVTTLQGVLPHDEAPAADAA